MASLWHRPRVGHVKPVQRQLWMWLAQCRGIYAARTTEKARENTEA
jgi:hypothetical protein